MSLETSLREAERALAQDRSQEIFSLSCVCGWDARESRYHLLERVRTHFKWSSEHIKVQPGP